MTYPTMAHYYAAAEFLPTHARLLSVQDLDAHAAMRERFLTDKMYLPSRLFSGARLIEFGPDTGENALAFARWGAHCTLVEPNASCHPIITEYFQRYQLVPWLEKVEQADISEYAARHVDPVFDMVVAEGFIYTVQPSSLWIDLFARLLKPGGMVLISYYEKYGGYVELLTKGIYKRVVELTGKPGIKIAHLLFDNKWSTIPHARTFEQWIADILENPFVDSRYFLEAETLCKDFESMGFRLYSSWPVYRNALDVTWHKLPERPGSRAEFISLQHDKWLYGNDIESAEACLTHLIDLLNSGTVKEIIRFCQTDETWFHLWGQPNHFAVFQKL